MSVLSVDDLRIMMRYNKTEGSLYWRPGFGRGYTHGRKVGSKSGRYLRVMVRGKNFAVHRLVWFYTHGEWPQGQIDHINGDGLDNRLENLRVASGSENMQNIRKPATNTSGLMGASWNKNARKWTAQIAINGRQKYLGLFKTAEDAHFAYLKAKAQLHTFCPEPRL